MGGSLSGSNYNGSMGWSGTGASRHLVVTNCSNCYAGKVTVRSAGAGHLDVLGLGWGSPGGRVGSNARDFHHSTIQIYPAASEPSILGRIPLIGFLFDSIFNATPANLDEVGLIGTVEPPSGLVFGTTSYGNYMHAAIADWFAENYPDRDFDFRVRPGQTGIDIEYLRGPDPGFKYAEIKPNTPSGQASYQYQLGNWQAKGKYLDGKIQPLAYDEYGRFYDRFR
jgi:hypothetical protein